MKWKQAFEAIHAMEEFGDSALGAWAVALQFGYDDFEHIATECITDGNDDKKCDFIHIDKETNIAVIGQCYYTLKSKVSAPSNKASDLNTAVAWLLSNEIEKIPVGIRTHATELRKGIENGTITDVHFWYVHNLPESKNVEIELERVQASADALIKRNFTTATIQVHAKELGTNELESLYQDTTVSILVDREYKIKTTGHYATKGENWEAIATAIPGSFIHKLWKEHKNKLFSANVRDYMGTKSSDTNINNGIQKSAKESPNDFWVFNNGLTVLSNNFSIDKSGELTISGISIVNGAQTSGAIGGLTKQPLKSMLIPARFIKTSNQSLLLDIIRFNNSQNKVTASDFRSTDRIQKRLREEIQNVPNTEYEGGRRGGAADRIQKRPNLMPSYTVGQAIASFHQDPINAYNKKSEIWVDDAIYSKVFPDSITGNHLIFCYSLLKEVEEKKKNLIKLWKADPTSINVDENLLAFFRKRGATIIFATGIAACIEILADRKIPNSFKISFGDKIGIRESRKYWKDIIDVCAAFVAQFDSALNTGLQNSAEISRSVSNFVSMMKATKGPNKSVYTKFAKNLKF